MFPLNLQKNIVQLDRQISLLENECKNIDAEKKRKCSKSELSYAVCNKICCAQTKSSTAKINSKKNGNCKRNKPTPCTSGRPLTSCSSVPPCSKTWSETEDCSAERKSKYRGSSNPVCCCIEEENSTFKTKKKCKQGMCTCGCEGPDFDLATGDCFEFGCKDKILRKDMLIPTSKGTYEVTVKRKLSDILDDSPNCVKSVSSERKSDVFESKLEKDFEKCNCQAGGKTWSEILSCDLSKKKNSKCGNFLRTKSLDDEASKPVQPLSFINNKKFVENFGHKVCAESPMKLSSKSLNGDDKKIDSKALCFKDICEDPVKDVNLIKMFQALMSHLLKHSGEESKNLPISPKVVSNLKEIIKKVLEEDKIKDHKKNENKTAFVQAIKSECDNLIKEKELLAAQVKARDDSLAKMKKREEEFTSLITSLKKSLEKMKETADQNQEAVKEVTVLKNKLLEQKQLTDAVQKKYDECLKQLQECTYENDKLKTEVKILKLESQKHEVIIAGKDAQICKYKEEIQNVQRQISDHLSALRSNAQGIDVEKMMEAIIKQSQVFAAAELNFSELEKDEKDSSNQNVLMHSSPTSTKTSVVNSSWKEISSIHEQSKAASDAVIFLNEEPNEKNFFQVFEKNSKHQLGSSKTSSVDKCMYKKEIKRSSSFTSCLSENEVDAKSSVTSHGDSVRTNNSLDDRRKLEKLKNNRISIEKAQNNIEELLKNMKLKFSKEIHEASLPSCTTQDLLDISQISSVTLTE